VGGVEDQRESLLSSLALALLLAALRGFPGGTPLDSITAYIESELVRQHIPGVSVGILRGDSVLLARGFGFSNLELHVPASDSTVYQSGSLGKQFTAAGVVTLAQQGRLRLDDRITRWLPEGAGVWDSITVRHLLTHTSGITEYTDSTFDYRKDYTEAQLVQFAAARPLDFRPGSRWSYSNTGYLLLGVLMHRVAGRFYGDVLRDLIFSPVGMRTTRIISEADIVPNRAAGYQLVKGRIQNQEWVAPSLNTTADGSLYFTVDDLLKWATSLNHRRVPSAAVLDLAWSPVRLNDGGLYPYGFGWDLTDQRRHARIGHTGSWQGFKTALYRYPDFNLTIIVLANLAQAQPGAMAEAIAGILEPELRPPHILRAPLPGPKPAHPTAQLLKAISSGDDTAEVTPALHRFLSDTARRDLARSLGGIMSWTELGCDDVRSRTITWLGSRITRACYARGADQQLKAVVSIFYAANGRAAHLDWEAY
jgi:CubicO group peptidase (beta-lactamase class C family)